MLAARRDPAARAIVRAWRRLTTPESRPRAGPGEPTLIACSGGADSTALVLALAAAKARMVVGHVVHDLRPSGEALADRDAVVELCTRLGVKCLVRSVRVKARRGNAEAVARRLRYAALVKMARAEGLAFVATAHHGHDQMESVLMHLLRGAGPRGLSGVAALRLLSKGSARGAGQRDRKPPIMLVRPMLEVGPADARRLCGLAGVAWREDVTNLDTSRLRAAIRHDILPRLLKLRPAAAKRIGVAAGLQGEAAKLIAAGAAALDPAAGRWPRTVLRAASAVVVGELLRAAVRGAGTRSRGMDRVGASQIGAVVRCVRSMGTQPREFRVGARVLLVTAREVTIT